jgi:excinuclease ABC subunit B
MQKALDETSRRRAKQLEFNAANGITPRGIKKAVSDILEGAYANVDRGPSRKVAESTPDYSSLTPDQALRRIKKLEQEMLKHARNLEFEEAARLRDQISQLRKTSLGLTTSKAG